MIVLVPDTNAAEHLASIEGVEPVVYGADGVAGVDAQDLARAEVLVAGGGVPAAVLDELLAAAPALRYLQTLGAGVEQWAGRVPEGVRLVNAKGAHGAVSAEWAAAALLATVREFPRFRDQQNEGRWESFTGRTLLDTSVLVLGAGDLAEELRARLEPFGVTLTLTGRTSRPGVVALADVGSILPDVDAVVAMLPLTDDTRHVVDAEFLAGMRDGAILVNVGRGGLVDTDALLAELNTGRLRAALDVTDPEPLPDGHPLWSAPGVLITPHAGGDVGDWTGRALAVVARQLEAVVRGDEPANLVDY